MKYCWNFLKSLMIYVIPSTLVIFNSVIMAHGTIYADAEFIGVQFR
jgi:hypothetical protein